MMIGDRVFREITDNVWDPKRRIEDCDRAGVSMQVLSTVPVMFSYWAKPADGAEVVSIISKDAVANLGLKVGMPAYAVIKASDVMVAK